MAKIITHVIMAKRMPKGIKRWLTIPRDNSNNNLNDHLNDEIE